MIGFGKDTRHRVVIYMFSNDAILDADDDTRCYAIEGLIYNIIRLYSIVKNRVSNREWLDVYSKEF